MDSVTREEDVRGSDSSPFGTFEGAIERTPEAARISSRSSRNLRLHPMIFGCQSRRVGREEIERREVEGQGLEEPCGDIDGTVIEIS